MNAKCLAPKSDYNYKPEQKIIHIDLLPQKVIHKLYRYPQSLGNPINLLDKRRNSLVDLVYEKKKLFMIGLVYQFFSSQVNHEQIGSIFVHDWFGLPIFYRLDLPKNFSRYESCEAQPPFSLVQVNYKKNCSLL